MKADSLEAERRNLLDPKAYAGYVASLSHQ
jgi:hypothetical protein